MIGTGRRKKASKKRFLFLTSVIDYLKNNEYRIATHSESRTDGPLASRSDLSKYVSLVKNKEAIDILALDSEKRVSLATCVYNDELVAHAQLDSSFVDGLKAILETKGEDIHYLFISNGVIFPHLVMSNPFGSGETKDTLLEELGVTEQEFTEIFGRIDFIETRFKVQKVHSFTDQKLYLRKVIGKVRKIIPQYYLSDMTCDCGETYLQGNYTINYWKKSCKCDYWVCPECGIQLEAENTVNTIANFLQSLS